MGRQHSSPVYFARRMQWTRLSACCKEANQSQEHVKSFHLCSILGELLQKICRNRASYCDDSHVTYDPLLGMMGRERSSEWRLGQTDTCVMHSSFSKMADSTDESPEIESLQEQSDEKEVEDRELNGDVEEEPAKGGHQAVSGGSKKKKKKKKGGIKGDVVGSENTPETLPTSGSGVYNLQNLRQLQNLQKSFELLRAGEAKAPKTTEEALKKKYQFWDTQPVPKLGGYGLVQTCSWVLTNCI